MNQYGILQAAEKEAARIAADVLNTIGPRCRPETSLRLESATAKRHEITMAHPWVNANGDTFEITTVVTVETGSRQVEWNDNGK